MILRYLFMIAIFSTQLSAIVYSQQDYSKLVKHDKLSVSGGFGLEYGVVGLRANYSLNDNFSLVATLGAIHYAKAGIELKAQNLFENSSLLPYLNLQFGVSDRASLNCYFSTDVSSRNLCLTTSQVSVNKTFYGPTISTGTKFKLFKRVRGYGTIGIRYSYVNKSSYRDFAHDFNSRYGANRSTERTNRISLSLGFTYVLKSSNPT